MLEARWETRDGKTWIELHNGRLGRYYKTDLGASGCLSKESSVAWLTIYQMLDAAAIWDDVHMTRVANW